MLLIHPKGIKGGDQYGTTMHNSDPAIDFPKKPMGAGFGKQTDTRKTIVGGTQYGTTQHDSKPYRDFPDTQKPLHNIKIDQRGSAIPVIVHKVVVSDQRDGFNLKRFNTATEKTASQPGKSGPAFGPGRSGAVQAPTDRVYPLATHYPLKPGGLSDMNPAQFQDQ